MESDIIKFINDIDKRFSFNENKENIYLGVSFIGKDKKIKNRFLPFDENIINQISKLSDCKDYNIYIGMGLIPKDVAEKYRGSSQRGKVQDIIAIPYLWAELDVIYQADPNIAHKKKELPQTQEEAISLFENLSPGNPPTYSIDSGHGIHAYWFLKNIWYFSNNEDRENAINLLSRLYYRIQTECSKQSWKPDNVFDLARIMRLVGTYNIKDPNNIKLTRIIKYTERYYELKELYEMFPEKRIESKIVKTTKKKKDLNGKSKSTVSQHRDANQINQYEDKPKLDAICKKCAFIKHAVEEADSSSEIEWFTMLTIVARCDNGEQLCHEISKQYPNYNFEETEKKIKHALNDTGPYTCYKIIENNGKQLCEQCKWKDEISSPIQLGQETAFNKKLESLFMLNTKHAVTNISGKFCILNEEIDPITKRKRITFSSRQDFVSLYENHTVMNGYSKGGLPKIAKLPEVWLEWPKRRQYDGIIFSPNNEVHGYYNLFQGFPYEGKEGDWSLFRNFILEVIANNDQTIFEWILGWVARILQDPGGVRPGTSIVMRGKQGVGKGTFVKYIGAMIGDYFLHISNSQQLVGKFNSHMQNAILVFCDEAFWAGDKAGEGILKAMITEETMMIEPKGKNAFSLENHINLIIASNNSWVVPAGLEERRFCVLEVSDRYQQNHEYFKAIQQQMENNGGIEAMVYDLMKYDLSKVNLRQIPRTNCLFDQILHNMAPFQRFWYNCLNFKYLGKEYTEDYHAEWEKGSITIPVEILYKNYLEFCQEIQKKEYLCKSKFGSELNKMVRGLKKSRLTLPNLNFPNFTNYPNNYVRRACYIIPELKKCREEFETNVNQRIEWDFDFDMDDLGG